MGLPSYKPPPRILVLLSFSCLEFVYARLISGNSRHLLISKAITKLKNSRRLSSRPNPTQMGGNFERKLQNYLRIVPHTYIGLHCNVNTKSQPWTRLFKKVCGTSPSNSELMCKSWGVSFSCSMGETYLHFILSFLVVAKRVWLRSSTEEKVLINGGKCRVSRQHKGNIGECITTGLSSFGGWR